MGRRSSTEAEQASRERGERVVNGFGQLTVEEAVASSEAHDSKPVESLSDVGLPTTLGDGLADMAMTHRRGGRLTPS